MIHRYVYAIYDFIEEYIRVRGYPPTYGEIAAGVGIHYNTLKKYLGKMEIMGMIERPAKKVRAIRLIRREANWDALENPRSE